MSKAQTIGDIDFEGVEDATIAALRELVRAEWEAEALQAQADIDAFAKHCRTENFNAVDGIGPVTRHVPAWAFHEWAAKENSYQVWADKSFNRYMDRIAPETRVKCVAPKSGNGLPLQVSFAGVNAPRFRKSYGDASSPSPGGEGRGEGGLSVKEAAA